MKGFTTLIFLLILILGAPIWVQAQQTGIITGIIADSLTKESLLGVNVRTGSIASTSDYIDGKYTLELEAGEHIINFSYLGYAPQSKTVTIEAGKTVVMNIEMSEEATILTQATVTSSKFKKPLGEVTVSLAIVSPDLIENTNANAVNQVLDKVPGVNTMGDQVTIRGGAGFAQGTGSRVLILMDDMPAMQADAGLPNWKDLPTENIAQMEVLKGSASALYGSSAMNGVINIRTAQPTKKPFTKVSLFGTMYGDPKDAKNKWWTGKNMPFETGLQIAHRRKIGKFDVVLGSNLFYNQSYMRGYRVINNEIDSTVGYDHKARVTANLRYRHSENLIFSLNTNVNMGSQNVFLFHARVDPNLGLYETDFDPAPRGQNFRMTIDPAVTYYDKFSNRHRAQFRYYYIDNNNDAQQSNSSSMFYGEYQYLRQFEQLGGLEVAAGLVGSSILSTAEVYSGASYNHNNFAAYLQVDKKFFKRLNISIGARYEINTTTYPDSIHYTLSFNGQSLGEQHIELKDTVEHQPVFRVGASYQLGKATFFRASWGQGYRFPTVLEKFISTSTGGITVAPNPGLKSEKGWSAEIGVKQGFKIGKWQGFLDIAGFWSEYEDMMEFQASREINAQFFNLPIAFQVQNIGNTRVTGVDVSLMGEGNIGPVDIQLMAGYTLLNPQYKNFEDSIVQADIKEYSTSTSNILKYRNRHTVKFDGQATYQNISLGFTFQYLSFMEAIDKFLDGAGTPLNPLTKIHDFRAANNTGSYVLNARVAYKIAKLVKLSLLMNNVLNDEYAIQPGKLEAPRNFTLRADFTF
ncbi:TonB-dependent receptor [Aureispira anguillae]|uniref:TonB-dependent receptor n=1 Tax=Aureispira anguillae TaxID=2864201 RepID=A0A915VMK5_9BACT|nr:TonB-dependent receptor [Aureispira anguillae]BDS09640.1 TonB-dependent receptor [Aureispira anguillae]